MGGDPLKPPENLGSSTGSVLSSTGHVTGGVLELLRRPTADQLQYLTVLASYWKEPRNFDYAADTYWPDLASSKQ